MPQIQNKKHPKYRKKLSLKEKKKLSLIKNDVKLDKLKKDIYRLPFDVKCKIFQMAMIANIPMWVIDLRPKFGFVKTEYFDTNKGIGYYDGNGFPHYFTHANSKSHIGWERKVNSWKSLDFWNIRNRLPCNKNVKTSEQRGIISVYISPDKEKPELVKYREFRNDSGCYWTHYKCRCYECDLVRVTSDGGHFKWSSIREFEEGNIRDKKYNKNYSKHKFKGITMDPNKITSWSFKK
jgi:hypothetical protein